MGVAKADISKKLQEVARLLELHGANTFKVRAFDVGAEIIESFDGGGDDLITAIAEGKVPGIGAGIKATIEYFAKNQTLPPDLEKEISVLPRSILELLKLPGIGPKKARLLYDALQICDVAQLEVALASGRVQEVKGFTEKAVLKLIDCVAEYKIRLTKALWAKAERFHLDAAEILSANGLRFECCGEYRRLCEIVNSYAIVIDSSDAVKVTTIFKQLMPHAVITQQANRISVVSERAPPLEVVLSNAEQFIRDVFVATGSIEHVNAILSRIPAERNFKTEEEIYTVAGMPFTLPEHREEASPVAAPVLVTANDIRGVIHAHTTYSDGKNTLREMALACRDLGYRYFGVSDHSQSARYAGGLNIDKIQRQHREIEALNKELAPFKILRGIESDILKDGSLDYDEEILQQFDFVVASVHGGFTLSREEQTARICRAVRNKYTTILGHPTGRLLLERAGYDVDLDQVIDVAAAEGKAIEINGNPLRLDLDWRWVRIALKKGVRIILTPDAHSISQLGYVRYALNAARKAGVTKESLLNF